MQYIQDWLTQETDPDNKQAAWRTDPARSGAGGCVGDIGTHAFNLAHFVTGLEVDKISAELTSFVPGRLVYDNVNARFCFKGGANGTRWAPQVAVGHENGLALRVYGDKGGITWGQENPYVLTFTPFGQAKQLLTRGGTSPIGVSSEPRVPPGHPEGYLEGFATIYKEAAAIIRGDSGAHAPGIEDGLLGMKFIAACVKSSGDDCAWLSL